MEESLSSSATIQSIGVIGAGVMGQGVAYQFAKYGYPVRLVDISPAHLDAAKAAIRNISRHDMLVNRPAKPADLGLIHYTTDLAEVGDADFLVENITENIDQKLKLYGDLNPLLKPSALLAVNTSAVSVTRLARLLQVPANVLGIHFMNPVHMKPTVEVIRGVYSSDATMRGALDLLGKIGIQGVVVQDSPGFVSNRVLMITINEAIWALQDGVSSAADIDRIFVECFGHKMGPLATGDLIGLDTILYTLEVLLDAYKDPKFRPAPLLVKLVDAGKWGRKTGEGVFKY